MQVSRAAEKLAEYARNNDLLATEGDSPELAISKAFYEEAVANMNTLLFKVVDAYEEWLKKEQTLE